MIRRVDGQPIHLCARLGGDDELAAFARELAAALGDQHDVKTLDLTEDTPPRARALIVLGQEGRRLAADFQGPTVWVVEDPRTRPDAGGPTYQGRASWAFGAARTSTVVFGCTAHRRAAKRLWPIHRARVVPWGVRRTPRPPPERAHERPVIGTCDARAARVAEGLASLPVEWRRCSDSEHLDTFDAILRLPRRPFDAVSRQCATALAQGALPLCDPSMDGPGYALPTPDLGPGGSTRDRAFDVWAWREAVRHSLESVLLPLWHAGRWRAHVQSMQQRVPRISQSADQLMAALDSSISPG